MGLILSLLVAGCGANDPRGMTVAAPPDVPAEVLTATPPEELPEELAVFPGRDVEFGAYPMGQRLATLPSDLRLTEADCDPSDPNNGDGSCLYRGADGVTYYILDRALIVNKWIDVADTRADRLPYGLTGRETPQQAVAHMQRHFSLPFKTVDSPDPDVQLVTVDGLFEGEGEMQFWIYLIFSADGRLEQIKLQGPPTI